MSKAKQSSKKAEEVLTENERLKAVRDLIFGENMVEYQQEFSQLNEQLRSQQQQSEKKLADETSALNERIDALEYSFNETVKALKKEMNDHVQRLESVSASIIDNRREVGQALSKIAETMLK